MAKTEKGHANGVYMTSIKFLT